MTLEDMDRVKTGQEKWREDLKEGSEVDLRILLDEKSQTYGWVQARVEMVRKGINDRLSDNTNQGQFLTLACPELPPSYDTIKHRYSCDLAERGGKQTLRDYSWKNDFFDNFEVLT